MEARGRTQLLVFVALVFPLFRPPVAYLSTASSILNPVYSAMLIIAFLVIAYRFVVRNSKITLFVCCFVLFAAVCLISTWMNSGAKTDCIVELVRYSCPVLMIASLKKEEVPDLLDALMIVLGFWMALNLLLQVAVPGGLFASNGYPGWIFQHGALQSRWCFVFMFVAMLKYMVFRKPLKATSMAMMAVCAVTLVSLGSATSQGGALAGIALFFVCWLAKRGVSAWYLILSGVYLAAVVLIVIIRVGDYLPYDQIMQFFGKTAYMTGATFTGRTYIWDSVISQIYESPYIGYGFQSVVSQGVVFVDKAIDFSSCHNLLLQLLHMSGFVGLMLFTFFFLASCLRSSRVKSARYHAVALAVLTAFLVSALFENILDTSFFMFICLLSSESLHSLVNCVSRPGVAETDEGGRAYNKIMARDERYRAQ